MATTHDKKKKGSFMNFYKSGTGTGTVAGDPFTAAPNYRPYSFPMTPPPTSNRPHSWLPKKKPTRNIFPDIKRVDDKSVVARKSSAVGQSQTPVEARRSFSHEEARLAAAVVEGRRSSVSSQVETNVAAVAAVLHVEARRSFSHAEAKLAAEGRVAVVVEGRRSVSSQVETNVAAVAAVLNVKVLVADMAGFMQVHAFRCARKSYDSLDKFSSKQMALTLKKEFDEVYGPAWHCIVGSSFGSFVTHGTGCFLYFSMDKLYILLFKTKVKRAS